MISHVMNLANGIIGVSVLAMPFCFKQCGIILATLVLLVSSILSRLACHFLIKSAVMSRRRNFETLAFHAFGPMGKFLVELCVIGFLLGTCTAYFVVVGDLGPQIVGELINKTPGDIRTSFLITTGIFIVLPLGLLRNIDSLASVSTASIAFYICLVLRIITESTHHIFAVDWFDKVHYWRPSGILQCLPIFALALFCQTQLFEIYEVVPNATLEKMNQIVRGALNICTSVYFCVGLFGYISFCNQPFTGNILMSFEPSFVSEVIKIGFVLSVAFSFPLVIFPCRASLNSLLFKRGYAHESSASYIGEGRFRCLTTFIVIVALTVGVLIPSIEFVLGIVGSTIGVMICLIFPAAFFIAMSTKNTNERLLAQLLIIIGVWIMILGTYANLYAMEQSSNLRATTSVTKSPSQMNNLPNILINNEMLIRPNNPKSQDELINIKGNSDDKLNLKAPDKSLANENQRKEPPVPEDNSKRKEPPVPIDETKWKKPPLSLGKIKEKEASILVENKPKDISVMEEKMKLKKEAIVAEENKHKEPFVSIEENKRQEPPIPVELIQEDKIPIKKQDKVIVKSMKVNPKIQEIVDKIRDDKLIKDAEMAYNSLKKVKAADKLEEILADKNAGPIEERDKVDGPKNDVIAVDAIKKEESELAADRNAQNDDSLQRREQLDNTLKQHIMEQNELIQEQKELIKDWKQKQKELNLVDNIHGDQEKDQEMKIKANEVNIERRDDAQLIETNKEPIGNNDVHKKEEIVDSIQLRPEIKRNVQEGDGQKAIKANEIVNNDTNNKVIADLDKKSDNQEPNNKLTDPSHSNLIQETANAKPKTFKDPIIQALTKQSNKISNENDEAESHLGEKNEINVDEKKIKKDDKYSVPIVLKLTNQTKQVLDAQPLLINRSSSDVGVLSRDILEDHQREKRMVDVEEITDMEKTAIKDDEYNLKEKSEIQEGVCAKTKSESTKELKKGISNEMNDLKDSQNLIKTNSYLSDQVYVNEVTIDPILNVADNFIKLKKRDLKAIKSENDDES